MLLLQLGLFCDFHLSVYTKNFVVANLSCSVVFCHGLGQGSMMFEVIWARLQIFGRGLIIMRYKSLNQSFRSSSCSFYLI